jgi:dihydroorotate dehydrogenase
MTKLEISKNIYTKAVKPILFKEDAELVHNKFTKLGSILSDNIFGQKILPKLFTYNNPILSQKINGVEFKNPIGLAAGFDYDGHLASIMDNIGFGFNTVGSVTAKAYEGNPLPRLGRLPISRSLLVNKGFKSEGTDIVLKRLRKMKLKNKIIGISVGSSNIPQINSIKSAIEDYLYTFNKFKNETYVSYFELNISCPNTALTENFGTIKNFVELLTEIKKLNIKSPIYVKMANETPPDQSEEMVRMGIKYGMSGFIFSNLVKDRNNVYFNKNEIECFSDKKGNFSGKPTEENANRLISHTYKIFNKNTTIIGCGGVFSAEDAYKKIKLGASLVQLISGMIYEGPQIAGEINYGLVKLLKRDGFENITEAIGKDI